jgi:hypothetical protein
MGISATDEYFLQKKTLLEQCLSLSEELISSIESWESLSDILSGRETVLLQIKELEESSGPETAAFLTEEMKSEIDQIIKLILNLDKDAAALIRREQQGVMDSLKANIKEQKFIQYAPVPELPRGRKLDYKK